MAVQAHLRRTLAKLRLAYTCFGAVLVLVESGIFRHLLQFECTEELAVIATLLKATRWLAVSPTRLMVRWCFRAVFVKVAHLRDWIIQGRLVI